MRFGHRLWGSGVRKRAEWGTFLLSQNCSHIKTYHIFCGRNCICHNPEKIPLHAAVSPHGNTWKPLLHNVSLCFTFLLSEQPHGSIPNHTPWSSPQVCGLLQQGRCTVWVRTTWLSVPLQTAVFIHRSKWGVCPCTADLLCLSNFLSLLSKQPILLQTVICEPVILTLLLLYPCFSLCLWIATPLCIIWVMTPFTSVICKFHPLFLPSLTPGWDGMCFS